MNQKMIDVLDKHIKFMNDKWGDDSLILEYGPAHIVYDDYNTGESSINFCKRKIDEYLNNLSEARHLPVFENLSEAKTKEALLDTLSLLSALLNIPEDERYVWEEED
jgi:hypothetical protein